MERKSRKEKLAIQIGIGLIAGTFSIVPVASGAPVLDKVVSGGASVNAGITTTVNSATRNNVIDWKDFSVAQGEKVQFDGGAKANNYLNIVTGEKTSQINGAIEGGANVYLVNPNGVIFGKSASVDVGNLYVSTRKASDVASNADLSEPTAVLVSSGTSSAAGDIVNLGKIQANAVVAEGKNIKFLNTADVTDLSGAVNTNVTLISNQGTIGIGERAAAASSNVLTASNSTAADTSSASSARASYNTLGGTLENYTLITNQSELQGMSGDLSGKYYLGNNITCSGTYTPVGTAAAPFTGIFDGQYFTVANINVSGQGYGGLFGYLSGATVKNVGVVNANVSAGYAGGIAGYAAGSTLINVYNSGGMISPTVTYQGGGIVGGTDSTTINSAYNTGTVTLQGGGIVGFTYGGVTIKDVYNTASLVNGIAVGSRKGSLAISNAYTVGSLSSFSSTVGMATSSFSDVSLTDSYKKASTYADSGWDISNVGGDNKVWRIYEGQTLPLLRAFLTANGTVTTNYDYTQGTKVSGSNGGKDLSLTYNNNGVNFSNVSYKDAGGSTITSGITQVADGAIRNVAYDTTNNQVMTTAAFYTGQDGYDLVGNNVTIGQREVTISDNLTGKSITKEYDGTTDASKAVSSLFYGDAGSATGILKDDSTVSVDSSQITATYDTANVGADKTVTINGLISLNNATGYHNYTLSATSASFKDKTITGNFITQKALTVSLNKSTGIDRKYNGETTVADAYKPSDTQITYDKTGLVTVKDNEGKSTTESIALVYDADAHYVDSTGAESKNAGTYTNRVKYSGIKLAEGTYSKNYKLVDAAGNVLYSAAVEGLSDTGINDTTGGALYGSGTIDKKNISSQGFSWYKDNSIQTASREYDNTSAYTDPVNHTVSNSGSTDGTIKDKMLSGDNLTFTVQSANFVTSSTDTSASTTVNAGDAKGVRYTVQISGADAVNYTLDNKDIDTTATQSVIGVGTITPRTINLAASTKSADKIYDGDANLKNGSGTVTEFGLSDGYVVYADAADASHHLLGDGSKIVITGSYQGMDGGAAKDVYIKDGKVSAKTVTYTAAVQDSAGTASTNYVFKLTDGTTAATQTLAGQGTINQRSITALSFKDISKTYDGSAAVLGQQDTDKLAVGSVTGLADGEKLTDVISTDSLKNVSGQYGSKAANGTFTPDANVVSTGKDVQYTGVRNILSNTNYVLDSSISDTAYGKGMINQLGIKDLSKLNLAADTITKVYDGSESVAHGSVTAASLVHDLTYKLSDTQSVTIGYTVDDKNAKYASKNSKNGTSQTVTYGLRLSDSGNYTVDSSLLTNGLLNWDKLSGIITPKTVTASITPANVTKVYDAGTSVKVNGSEISGAAAVTLSGMIDGTNSSTAIYDNKNVGANKNITYSIVLDSDSQGNYKVVDSNKNVVSSLNGTGTITPATLNVSFNKAEKKYDGTTAVTSTITPEYSGILSGDTVSLDADKYAAAYNSANVKDATTVTYQLHLTGTDAGNYAIGNADGSVTDIAGNKILTKNGTGTITAKDLSDKDVVISFGDITKVYDATQNVAYDHASSQYADDQVGSKKAADFVNSITIGGIELKAYTIKSAIYDKAGVDATKATYEFQLDTNALSNFDLSTLSGTLYKDGILTGSHAGTITPKNVVASLSIPTPITKVYDGNDKLIDATGKEMDSSSWVKVAGLITSDGTAIDTTQIDGHYDSKNVARDTSKNVTSQNVYYDVVLKGDAAKNYVVRDTSGKQITTLTGTGTITPKELTAAFDRADKTYDATTAATVVSPTVTGMVNGETVALSASGITGKYGNWTNMDNGTAVNSAGIKGSFTEDANVNWNTATKTEDDKALSYSGLQTALTDGTGLASNYTIADTVYFSEAAQKGKIKRLALASDAVKEKWVGTITKEYDGTAAVLNPTDHFSLYVEAGGKEVPLAYNLASAVYNGVDVTDATTKDNVTYTINGLEDKEFQNFDMSKLTDTSFNLSKNTTGAITPQVITAEVIQKTGLVKVYDGNANSDTLDNVTFKKGILDRDKGTVTLAVTGAAYGDKMATIDPDEAAQNKKTITYTIKLSGNDKGNYTLDTTGTKAKGDANETSKTATATGDISRRKVYVKFTGDSTGLDKRYDGTANAGSVTKVDGSTVDYRDRIGLAAADSTTGVVDKDIELLANSISAAYESPNVKRDSKGKVTTQDVTFSNFNLTDTNKVDGDDAGNYVVKAMDGTSTLTGQGTISPRTINVSVKAGPNKEYDGTTAVEGTDYTTIGNINVDKTNIVGPDSLNIALESAPSYGTKNAGTGIGYSYTLNWDNGNYELALAPSANGQSLLTGELDNNNKLTATLTGSNGTITPRILSVEKVKDADKEYDGTTAVKNAEANIVLSNRIISGDNIGLIAAGTYVETSAGADDAADAASGDGSDALLTHGASYKLMLSNSNYKLAEDTAQGQGVIHRKGLDIVAEPVTVNVGTPMPTAFSGRVDGLTTADSDLSRGFTFRTDSAASTAAPGIYGVYGWYNGRMSGNLGRNYTFRQAPGNAKAFTVQQNDPGMEYHNTISPAGQFTPDHMAYMQASKDQTGSVGGTPSMGLEYHDSTGRVVGAVSVESGNMDRPMMDILQTGQIGISRGNVVNLSNAEVANSASIKVDSSGTVVDLEIVPIETAVSSERQASAAIETKE